MSIVQRDLDHQQGTDARALAYLLKPENDFYMVTRENGERRTTLDFLRVIAMQEPSIRVLLDVGAQILDFSNRQVAKAWLDIAPDVAGAIYFSKDDELMVLTQDGITLAMLSSPLSQRLDRCVVYLDHTHTGGTDIKFPTVQYPKKSPRNSASCGTPPSSPNAIAVTRSGDVVEGLKTTDVLGSTCSSWPAERSLCKICPCE